MADFPTDLRMFRSQVSDLGLSYVDAETIQIAIGACRDKDDTWCIELGSSQNVDLSASGANGLDADSEAADTWYAVHLIGDSTEANATAGLLSLSATAPTLPSGYDKSRRIGWVRNNNSSNIISFIQIGSGSDRKIFYDESAGNTQVLSSGTATTFEDVDCSSLIPSTSRLGNFHTQFENGTAGAQGDSCFLRPNGATGSSIWSLRWAVVPNTEKAKIQVERPVDSSQKVEYKVDDGGTDANKLSLSIAGYTDHL